MGYCLASDVGVLLGLTYNATSLPTETQVNSIIDQVSAEINMTLRTIGVVTVTDATVLSYLKMVCAKGSACYVGGVYFNNIQSTGGTISNFYCQSYKEELKKMIDNPAILGVAGGTIAFGSNVTDGVTSFDEADSMQIDNRFRY